MSNKSLTVYTIKEQKYISNSTPKNVSNNINA